MCRFRSARYRQAEHCATGLYGSGNVVPIGRDAVCVGIVPNGPLRAWSFPAGPAPRLGETSSARVWKSPYTSARSPFSARTRGDRMRIGVMLGPERGRYATKVDRLRADAR